MADHGVTRLPGQLNDADGKSINISRLIHQPADASNGVLACLGQFHEPWMSTEEPFLDFPAVPGKQALLLRPVEVPYQLMTPVGYVRSTAVRSDLGNEREIQKPIKLIYVAKARVVPVPIPAGDIPLFIDGFGKREHKTPPVSGFLPTTLSQQLINR